MATFETPEPIAVTVQLGIGDVWILASDRTDTIVEVRPSDPAKRSDVAAAEQTRVEYANGRLQIRAPKGWRQYSWRGGRESIDVEIQLPTGSQVQAELGVASLRASGRLGGCRVRTGIGDLEFEHAGPLQVKTGAGDVTVDRAVGRTEVTTGTGAVRIGSIDGPAMVKNSTGDTWIGEVTGETRVSAAHGAISIDRAHAAVDAKTAFGDVRLGEVARGAVLAESGFGRVEVGIREGVAAWLDLSTRFGNVANNLDAAEGPEQGEDAVDLRARTTYGDITVRRSVASVPGRGEA